MYNCGRFNQYIDEVRKYLQDIPSKRYLHYNPDGTEFSNDEICDALKEASTRWESLYETTYFLPVIPLPAIKWSFLKLTVGILLKKKGLYYMQNAASIGDAIEVNDFEMKMQLYVSIGEQLQQEAEQELYQHKWYLLNNIRLIR
jgi:hypothetical protein